jgi:betaine-aldehyde dehydrogenase
MTTVDTTHVIPVLKPADGRVLAELPVDEPDRVAAVAARLREAQPEWEALGFAERARWMARMRDWLLDNTERVVDVMEAEAGKVRTEARLEIGWVCDIINNYSRRGPSLLADRPVRATMPALRAVKRYSIQRRPHPLVGVIGPWNFPIVLTFGDAVPALLAGAAVMLKPSEVTPLSVRELVRAWREELGAPPVLEAVYGAAETGGALVDAVDFVGFTGSTRTGKAVARRAAETLTPVSLELGGKDPMIVLRDADLERAANAATWGGFVNSGQVCISVERVYVEEPVYDEFVSHVVTNVDALRHGIDLGAMISPAQIGIVEDHVADAVGKGARVLTGGRRAERSGDWFEPTVLVDVDHDMAIMREETFGPVLPIMKVADRDEAIRLANDSPFGLGATVFSGDARAGEELARRVDAGTVNVNDALHGAMCIDVPMGGWKASGIGARSGDYGMLKYTRAKTVTAPRLPAPASDPLWFPYDSLRARIGERSLRFMNARGRRRWRSSS